MFFPQLAPGTLQTLKSLWPPTWKRQPIQITDRRRKTSLCECKTVTKKLNVNIRDVSQTLSILAPVESCLFFLRKQIKLYIYLYIYIYLLFCSFISCVYFKVQVDYFNCATLGIECKLSLGRYSQVMFSMERSLEVFLLLWILTYTFLCNYTVVDARTDLFRVERLIYPSYLVYCSACLVE